MAQSSQVGLASKRPRNVEAALTPYMLDTRRIFVVGSFSDAISKSVVYQLKYMSDKNDSPIYIYIDSEGGDIDVLFTILNELEIVKKNIEVYTIVQGIAYSAAACLLSQGTKGLRFAHTHSQIMLHPIQYDLPSDYEQLQAKLNKHIKVFSDKLHRLVAASCDKSFASYSKSIKNGLWMDATEALKFKVIDGIWTNEKEKEVLQMKNTKQLIETKTIETS